MTPKIKTTLLTAFFLFGVLTSLQAQEKYEYATVQYLPPIVTNKPGIHISVSGKAFEIIEVKKEETKSPTSDFTIVLNYIQSMTDNGWRVMR